MALLANGLLRRYHHSSISNRPFRYFILAIALLVIFTAFLSYPLHNPHKLRNPIPKPKPHQTQSANHIQFSFGEESDRGRRVRIERQQQVRDAFVHAWGGYKKHAWLHDEVMPLSGGKKDPFVGWAATLVDGLDSLYIFGLQDEFDHALGGLQSIDFSKPNTDVVPLFETTIRYLGGLLGAYDISEGKYPILLEKADQLGEFLLQAFKTPNGIPVPYYSWKKTKDKLRGSYGVIVAQIGSLSLEFTRLAQLTGKQKYFDAISKLTDFFDRAQDTTSIPGLWPSKMDTIGPSFPSSSFTLGAWADSLYEYLPKEHLLLGGRTNQYLKMYQKALKAATTYHFFRPKTPGNQDILFTGSIEGSLGKNRGPSLVPEVQHLGCYVGGMVGLGARINDSPEELAMAIKLTNSCVWAYQNTATGIMPEIFNVNLCPLEGSCNWTDPNSVDLGHQYGFGRISDRSYQLRPEAIESIFYMYRITGDPIWQEKGWTMFQAIMKHTKTSIANARLDDVTSSTPGQVDSMESFWLAETLKYFFLLFSEPDKVSLDEYVLNTEAHPFRQRDRLFDI